MRLFLMPVKKLRSQTAQMKFLLKFN